MFAWLLVLLAPLSTGHQLRSNTVQHFSSRRCSPEIAEYYNETLQSCAPCIKCLPGFGRDFDSRIKQDEHGEPLTCFPCVLCQNGTHSSTDQTCIPCRVCSRLSRNVTSACTPHSDTVCGGCSPGFYDYFRLSEDEDVSKPCRNCRYAETDVQECRKLPDNDKHEQDPAITVSLIVFGVFVGVLVLILVLCWCKWLRRKVETGYRELVPEENSESCVASTHTPSSTIADTDQVRQESQSSASREHRISQENQSVSSANLSDHKRPDPGAISVPAANCPETKECNNGNDRHSLRDSTDGIPLALTRYMPDHGLGGERTRVVRETNGIRPVLQPSNIDNRRKANEFHHAGATSTVLQKPYMIEDVSCRTQIADVTSDVSEIFTLHQQLAEDGDLFEDQDVVNVNLAAVLPVDESSAAASSCTQSPDNGSLVQSSNHFFRKPALLRSVSYPIGSGEMVPRHFLGANGSEASAEERVVTNIQLDMVAEELGPSYIGRLLRQLRLDHADQKLDDLKDHQFRGRELVYQALLRWKQSCGCQATDQALCSALCNIGRTDVSDRLKKTEK